MFIAYIIICLFWGVFFTGHMFWNWRHLDDSEIDRYLILAAISLFVVSTLFAPISIYNNLPYVIRDLND